MTAYAKDKITKENIEVPTEAEFLGKSWQYAGTSSYEGEWLQIPFSGNAASTMLILTVQTTKADLNGLFLLRKTMSDGSNAWKLSDLGLEVYCGKANGKALVYPREDNTETIAVYYQIIQ